ncbi:MAG: redoxin domain-containing protein [Bacteroidales bacterium]|nr:redoxin domain-containing protein [Bacteroidales bacterium]MBK7626990.1 redoxin domain-containing protein [Bacteroidales bacterium]
MKRILFLLTLIIIVASCQDKSKFSVTGVIKGETKKQIYLNRLEVDNLVFIDSAKVNSKGEFRFSVKATDADFYQIGFSESDFITILAEPGEKIKLLFEGKTLFEKYSVEGSEGSEKLQYLDNTLADTKRKLDSLSTVYAKASKEPGFDVAGPLLEEKYNKVLMEQRMKNIDFIIKNTGSLASIKAVYQRFSPEAYVLYDPKDLQFMKIVTDSLSLHYPKSKHVQALSRDFSKEMNNMYVSKLEEIAKDLPPTKLDPDLKNTDGKRIALSSLKGKYVLLTFWSIRSQECVNENLQLKQYYKIYKNKGFEIYQINIDEDENAWKSAVKFDELPWISTREDDPANPVNVVLFNVKAVPTNYLFDKEGKIIGTNLHGKSLQIKLDQLLN